MELSVPFFIRAVFPLPIRLLYLCIRVGFELSFGILCIFGLRVISITFVDALFYFIYFMGIRRPCIRLLPFSFVSGCVGDGIDRLHITGLFFWPPLACLLLFRFWGLPLVYARFTASFRMRRE